MEDGTYHRKLYIMRHGERVDSTFKDWISSCFDEKGNYIRNNLNMPLSVPRRMGGPANFLNDTPLTRLGLHQSFLTGEAMKFAGVTFSHVFCPPPLRCVETCAEVLKASEQTHLPINLESGLFTGLHCHQNGVPNWMSVEELRNHGFNVSLDYEPVIASLDGLERKQSSDEFYARVHFVTTELLRRYSGNILFVAHGSSLDLCSRQLIGKPTRELHELEAIRSAAPYVCVVVVEHQSGGTWRLAEPPFHPLRHGNNSNYTCKKLLD